MVGRVRPSAHPQVSSIAPEFAHFPQVDSVFKFELQSQKLREPATSSPTGGAPTSWKFRLPDYELANDKVTQPATLAEQGRIFAPYLDARPAPPRGEAPNDAPDWVVIVVQPTGFSKH